ncbi:MAG: Clp protease N-terminal domain-containing protein [Hyphomicrobiaceae bacterium]
MIYRGHDLDLRTPAWRGTEPARRDAHNEVAEREGGDDLDELYAHQAEREIPIWVDETVLACCNHAFDVALAHRSAEVRVEHLLHALTRIDASASVLEHNGIRASSLRRETATVIANEIPVALGNGGFSPRRADGFEEALRLAAAHAYQRNQPVNVEDLLHVFLVLRPAIEGMDLVARHLSARRVRPEQQPATFYYQQRPSYALAPAAYAPPSEPRGYEDAYEARGWRPSGGFYDAGFEHPFNAPPRRASSSRERVRPMSASHQAGLAEPQASSAPVGHTAPAQSSPPPRPVLAEQPAPANSPAPEPKLVMDPMQAATDRLQNSRLDALEKMVREISGQITGQRDDAVRMSDGLFNRLASIQALVSARPENGPAIAEVDLSGVEKKLAEMDMGRVEQRLAAIDLGRVEQQISALDQQFSARLSESTSNVSQKIAALEAVSNLGEVIGRLELIEEALLGRDGEISGDLDSRVKEVAEAVSLQQTTLDDARAALSEDVRDVNISITEQSSRITSTGESLGELVRAVESLRDEERNTVAQVGNLLSSYRSDVQGYVAKTNEVHEARNTEIKEVHEALMKLNSNQHTLAGSIDKWRSDGAGDMALLAARIEELEREAARPMALLETLSANMENMHRLTVERYHRRNRFWYWLFGTDDWVAASWPSQSSRIEAERAALNS